MQYDAHLHDYMTEIALREIAEALQDPEDWPTAYPRVSDTSDEDAE
jgi:hypothetical protein